MPEINSVNLYDNVSAVDYSMNPNTKGGAKRRVKKVQKNTSSSKSSSSKMLQGQQTQRQERQQVQQPIIVGGCLTCPKGKKKILSILKLLTVLIPKQYAQYKKMFNKGTQTKPIKKTNKRHNKKGGSAWFGESDHCLECSKLENSKLFEQKYNPQIMDTTYMNFYDGKPYGIYNLDTSLTDYTSRMAF